MICNGAQIFMITDEKSYEQCPHRVPSQNVPYGGKDAIRLG